jgi:hypothetical protein
MTKATDYNHAPPIIASLYSPTAFISPEVSINSETASLVAAMYAPLGVICDELSASDERIPLR